MKLFFSLVQPQFVKTHNLFWLREECREIPLTEFQAEMPAATAMTLL